MPIPAACRHVQDEINGLLQERNYRMSYSTPPRLKSRAS